MSKLTKLSIKKFRNVAPTTLEFSPGLNVLLGRNAAGKTTLLRLLSTALGASDEALRDDVLDMSYHASDAVLGFEHTITRVRGHEPALTFDPTHPVREDFSVLQRKDSFIFEKNGTVVMRAEVLPKEIVLEMSGNQVRVENPFKTGPLLSLYWALSQKRAAITKDDFLGATVSSSGRMDESLERFDELLKYEVKVDKAGDDSHWGKQTVPLWGREVFPEVSEGTSATFSPKFLERAARVLGYASANVRFDVEHFRPEPDRSISLFSNLRFFFKRPNEEISHNLLSYGQKRLLAFFAHVELPRDVVIVDELVNGLHHEWISACLEEIGDRQAFLTSQNPLLLDFLRFESVEEVRRTFILCERASSEAGAQLIWRNPTEEEAESFFSAYQTGIQRVSDILLTKGLW